MFGSSPTAALLAAIVASLAACSPSNGDGAAPALAGGSAGVSGAAVGGSTAGSPPAGSSGTGGGSGGSMASGGASGASGVGGVDGVGGTTGGSAGGGAGGSAGVSGGGGGAGGSAGGGGFWGPAGPKKQWSCPAGPFPKQMLGASTDICGAPFKYNYSYNEGPTWIASAGAFFFSNFVALSPNGGDIIKYTPGGQCEVWVHDVGCDGLAVSPSGNLLGACFGPRAIMEYDVQTKAPRMVASMVDGKMFDAPNDLIARSDGNVYFSNRLAESGNRPVGINEALIRIDPTGVTSVILKGGLNGIALSPDETKLYVVGMGTFPLDAAGLPGAKGQPTPGGDGIAVDCADAISINGTNSAFGGPDGKTLLVVGGGTMARTVQTTVPGLP